MKILTLILTLILTVGCCDLESYDIDTETTTGAETESMQYIDTGQHIDTGGIVDSETNDNIHDGDTEGKYSGETDSGLDSSTGGAESDTDEDTGDETSIEIDPCENVECEHLANGSYCFELGYFVVDFETVFECEPFDDSYICMPSTGYTDCKCVQHSENHAYCKGDV